MRISQRILFRVRGIELPNIDIYTGRVLSIPNLSKEHLIPKKFFRNKKHANHPLNVVPCHKYINNQRSDYRFGDVYIDLSSNTYDYDPIHIGVDDSIGIINHRHRVFYPSHYADKGLIARNCLVVLDDHHYLYRYLDEIIEHPALFDIWRDLYPVVSKYERSQNRLLAKLKCVK